MAFENDDIEVGTPVANITGAAAQIVSLGGTDGLRLAAITNALGAQGVSVQSVFVSSPTVSGFNAASVGGVSSTRLAVAPAMGFERSPTQG